MSDYGSRVVREAPDIDRDVLLRKVYFPALKHLGIDRSELARVASEDRRAVATHPTEGDICHKT